MKKLLLALLFFTAFVAVSKAQLPAYPGYTNVNSGYQWLRGLFQAFGAPSGGTAAFATGQLPRAGALYYDSTGIDSGFYVWSGLAWREVGSGTDVLAALPLYFDGDTLRIDAATAASDGYATAAQIAKLDTLANNWVRLTNYLYPANTTDSVIIGTPTTTLHKFNLIGNMHFAGTMFTVSNRRALEINTATQNVFIGGRSGNATVSGQENAAFGELSGGSLTSGTNNTFFGKGAGFTVTTGSNNVIIGRNVHASGGNVTGSNNVAIGANVPDVTASDQLNFNNWIYGASGRLGIGAITNAFTPTATLDIDSAVGYAHLRLRAMAADPTTVNNGNVWHYNNHLWARLNGNTYQLDQQTAATPGIDDVLAVGQLLTTNRTLNIGANVLNIGGTGQLFLTTTTSGTPILQAMTQPATTNTTEPVASFRRATTGTAANNIAGNLDFILQNASGGSVISAAQIWKFTNATAGAETSNVIFKGVSAGASVDLLTMQPGYTLNNNGADTLETRAGARSRAETVTNKRNVRRVTTIASSATPTPAGDDTDIFTVTALATGATFAAPTGTPIAGQGLIMRIKDNGGAQTLAWNAIYRAGDISLPTTTVAGKYLWLGFIYNDQSSTWDLLSKIDNF